MLVDPLEALPGYVLRRASQAAMARLARRFAVLGLRPSEASVLLIVEANPDVTQAQIGRRLDIATANMAPLVARLEKRGLVGRRPADGRSHGLQLSVAGRRLVARVHRAVARHEQELTACIPPRHYALFLATLRRIRDGA
jgi:DNA-binding MarR family transcriptional regulator